MQFLTIAILTFASLVLSTGKDLPSVTQCQTLTSTIDPSSAFNTCIVLACLEVTPITQKCGCSTIPTTSVTRTACPTSCGSTSYITAIEDCFPTQHPSSTISTSHDATTTSSLSNTSSTYPSPDTTHPPLPPNPSTSTPSPHPPPTTIPPQPNPYTNTTKTITRTEHATTTLTTCPAKETCTGQTITYTSTEICPTSTCVCVLPSVTFITTVLPVPTNSPGGQQASASSVPRTTRPGNTPPAPLASPNPTFVESNIARRWSVEAGVGLMGAFVVALAGLL